MDLMRTRPSARLEISILPAGAGPPAAATTPEPDAPDPRADAWMVSCRLRQLRLIGPAARASR